MIQKVLVLSLWFLGAGYFLTEHQATVQSTITGVVPEQYRASKYTKYLIAGAIAFGAAYGARALARTFKVKAPV